jgi:hypothetical protein
VYDCNNEGAVLPRDAKSLQEVALPWADDIDGSTFLSRYVSLMRWTYLPTVKSLSITYPFTSSWWSHCCHGNLLVYKLLINKLSLPFGTEGVSTERYKGCFATWVLSTKAGITLAEAAIRSRKLRSGQGLGL